MVFLLRGVGISARLMPGGEDHREAQTLAHYVEARAAAQCAAHHLWISWSSPTNILVYKDLSAITEKNLRLTVTFALC
jgi:hypothetical protein